MPIAFVALAAVLLPVAYVLIRRAAPVRTPLPVTVRESRSLVAEPVHAGAPQADEEPLARLDRVVEPILQPTQPRASGRPGQRPASLGRTPFAVIDVETTGFNAVPKGTHRIVEIAIVRLSPDGRVQDEYVTLLNPEGKMGATHVHGIRAADVAGAPVFRQVVGDIGSRIADAIVVGHNVNFDLRFLRGEFQSAGISMPEVPTLCTLHLAQIVADLPCRKLEFLCDEYGIQLDAHGALSDARAASKLLTRFLAEVERRGLPTGFTGGLTAGSAWFEAAPSGLAVTRSSSPAEPSSGTVEKLEKLVARRSSRQRSGKGEEQYIQALELALADHELTPQESAALCALALELGVSMSDMHRRYLRTLVEGAKADGVVTPEEFSELSRVCSLLAVPSDELTSLMIEQAPVLRPSGLARGTAVCFLGVFDDSTMRRISNVVGQRQLVFRKNITATINLVVAESARADPRRQDRARALGIPVISAAEFLEMGEAA